MDLPASPSQAHNPTFHFPTPQSPSHPLAPLPTPHPADGLNSSPIFPSFETLPNSDTYPSSPNPSHISPAPGIILLAGKLGPDAPKYVYRLYTYRDAALKRAKSAMLENRRKEVDGCTFTPALVTTRRKSQGHTTEDMYREAMEKGRRAGGEAGEGQEGGDTFRPELSDRTKEIMRDRNPKGVYQRLYSMTAGSGKTGESLGKQTFRPTINKRSEDMLRDQPIDVLLYADAQRRLQPHPKPAFSPRPLSLSKKSLSLLQHRFHTEFSAAIRSYPSLLSFSQVVSILIKLYFIREKHEGDRGMACLVWEHINKANKASPQDLYLFLSSVLGIPADSIPPETAKYIHTAFHDLWAMWKYLKPGGRDPGADGVRWRSRPYRTEDYLHSRKVEARQRAEVRVCRERRKIAEDLRTGVREHSQHDDDRHLD